MQHLYRITMPDANGRRQGFNVVTDSMVKAIAIARTLAGVGDDVEPSTFQNTTEYEGIHHVDAPAGSAK